MDLKRRLRKAEKIWRFHRKKANFETLKSLRNEYTCRVNRAKRKAICEKVLMAKGDSKKLFSLVSELCGTKPENPLPSEVPDEDLANQFADYFMNKIKVIRDSLRDLEQFTPPTRVVPPLISFKDMTEDEVKQLISQLNITSSKLDVLPTKLM